MRFAAIVGKSIGYGFISGLIAYSGGIFVIIASDTNYHKKTNSKIKLEIK